MRRCRRQGFQVVSCRIQIFRAVSRERIIRVRRAIPALRAQGLTKTIKPLPFAQCPETGFDLNADGAIDRMSPFTVFGVRQSGPEDMCATRIDFCIDL